MNTTAFPTTAILLLLSFFLYGPSSQNVQGVQATTTTTDDRKLIFDQPLAGGFQHVDDVDEQPMIQEAANFALQEMQDTVPYGFGTQAFRVSVVDAWQQVVQGLNFQLTLEFHDSNDDCVGACSVLVYNQFGTLSITQWNKEITCEEAKALTEDSDGDEN
ncbi:hypothetical protein IV203_026361 [Nitzschia inconspicua]|uniref:Cystatin domain-containing protein n=1 Tax=Nitzschia inconspicua TaxID=303405 RepID=A0A9K3LM64_9STRA|nr:hypothetical protein IV203_026361 [Nitzschia inconspicua]